MTQAKGGLGKGLASLIPSKVLRPANVKPDETMSGEFIHELSVASIKPNPHQPRKLFAEQGIEELMSSIKEYGILQPLIVTEIGDGAYELVAGERRWRAAKLLGLATVPVIIRRAGEMEKLELSLIENLQREDLNPIERAEAYHRLIDEFGLTREEAAKRLGKSRSVVANALGLLSLPTEIQLAVSQGKISEGHARVIVGLSTVAEQLNFFKQIVDLKLNVRQTEQAGRKIKVRPYTRRVSQTDPALLAKEEQLRQFFGTRVRIKKSGQAGHIEISFFSDEELEGILRRLSLE